MVRDFVDCFGVVGMGKGSKRRPSSVSEEHVESEWQRIFARRGAGHSGSVRPAGGDDVEIEGSSHEVFESGVEGGL